jgi:hypothetical protein
MDTKVRLAYERMVGDSTTIVGKQSVSMALRLAKTEGCYKEVAQLALDARRASLTWLTVTQRKWQTKVSRRPQRGNHHDSWSIREKYVRCSA